MSTEMENMTLEERVKTNEEMIEKLNKLIVRQNIVISLLFDQLPDEDKTNITRMLIAIDRAKEE